MKGGGNQLYKLSSDLHMHVPTHLTLSNKPDVVMYAFNSKTWKAEAGDTGIQNETLSH